MLLICAVPTCLAQSSDWAYPYGNLEATKNNPAKSLSQNENELEIKWRTSYIKSSNVLLVSKLLQGVQGKQLVGTSGDTIVVMNENGFIAKKIIYKDSALFSRAFSYFLTGLFNTNSNSPISNGISNAIGIGIEANQRLDNNSEIKQLWAFIADTNGNPLFKITIDTIRNTTFNNQIAGLFPFCSYTPNNSQNPIAMLAISQDKFQKIGNDLMINGFRLFTLDKKFNSNQSVLQNWEYPIAPMTYNVPPSLHFNNLNQLFVAFPTLSYSDVTGLIRRPPTGKGDATNSNLMYSIELRCDSVFNNQPTWGYVTTRKMPETQEEKGECNSYFVHLFSNPSSGNDAKKTYRLMTKNHNTQLPGNPSIMLAPAEVEEAGTNYGVYTETENKNTRWTITTGDFDGNLPNSKKLPARFPNNKGNEVLASLNYLNDELNTNYLYLFRNNIKAKQNNLGDFHLAFKQQYSGKLLCVGDLISDEFGRAEAVISKNDEIAILQLRDYDDNDNNYNTDLPSPFKEIKRFKLDSKIINAVIADLDNDSNNELIVTTSSSSYVIGKKLKNCFQVSPINKGQFCWGEEVKLSLEKKVGTAENGVSMSLVGKVNGELKEVKISNYNLKDNKLDVKFLVPQEEGDFKIFIKDEFTPNQIDSSITLKIIKPKIGEVGFSKFEYLSGEQINFENNLICLDTTLVEYSFDKQVWSKVMLNNVTKKYSFQFATPRQYLCGATENYKLYIRQTALNNFTESRIDSVIIKNIERTIHAVPDESIETRTRAINWNKNDFTCAKLSLSIRHKDSLNWIKVMELDKELEKTDLYLTQNYIGEYIMKLCCEDSLGEFAIKKIPTGEDGGIAGDNIFAPNPFSPQKSQTEGVLVYTPKNNGKLNAVILDASRKLVVEIAQNLEVTKGKKILINWNGKNLYGDYVKEGTYICIVKVGEKEVFFQPIIIN